MLIFKIGHLHFNLILDTIFVVMNMQENMYKLKKEFERVKAMGWIPAPHNRNNEQGSLFERMINKPEENFEIPDFEGIEIKTHIKNSKYFTTLFNANPEGKDFFEVNRLCNKYGYPDSKLKTARILYGNVSANEVKRIGLWYKYKLIVDREEERVYLCIYNHRGKLIEKNSYWDFSILKEKLERKLSYLAYITVDRKNVQGQYYFKYTDIHFYKLKNFSMFLNLLEEGKIIVCFNVGVFRTGKRMGQIRNHGIRFNIAEENMTILFSLLE